MCDHETVPESVDPPSVGGRWFAPVLALIGLAGFLGRWAYLVASRVDEAGTGSQGDALWYWATAENLADGQLFRNLFTGEPTAEHPPLTVVVLAPVAGLFDGSTWAGRMTMVVLGSITIVVMGVVARRLAGPGAGLATAAAVALSPALWPGDVVLMSETVTALALALLLWSSVALSARATVGLAALTGAACGLAALARSELLLLLPLLVWPVLLVSDRGGWRRRIGLAGVATAATAAMLAPWAALNASRFAGPVLISTNDGVTLAGANCDAVYGGPFVGRWNIDPCITSAYERAEADKPRGGVVDACPVDIQQRAPCWDESEASDRLRSEAVAYIQAHRAEVPRVVLIRNARVWGLHRPDQSGLAAEGEGREGWTVDLGFAWTWALAPFSVYGLILLRRRGHPVIPYVAMLVVVVLATSASSGSTVRPRLPWDLASCIPAGVALAALATTALARLRRSA